MDAVENIKARKEIKMTLEHSRCPLCGKNPFIATHFILPPAQDESSESDVALPRIPDADEYDPDVVCMHFVAHCGDCGLCARPAWRNDDDAWENWEELVVKIMKPEDHRCSTCARELTDTCKTCVWVVTKNNFGKAGE